MLRNKNLVNQAFQFEEAGYFSEASQICQEILVDNPDDGDALHLLGILCNNLGKYRQAVIFFERSLLVLGQTPALLHNYAVALQGLDFLDKASKILRLTIALDPKKIESRLRLGEIEFTKENWLHAKKIFKKVLVFDPDNIEALNFLGITYRRLESLIESRFCFQKILNINDKNPAVQNNLGITETQMNNFRLAKIAFLKALTMEPKYSDAYYNLGNVHLAELEYELASNCFSKSLEIQPANKMVIYNLVICRQKQNLLQEALNLVNELVELSLYAPNDFFRAIVCRANIKRDLGLYNDALVDIKLAESIEKNNPILLSNKALIYHYQGCFLEAIREYRCALKLDPDNRDIRLNIAQTMLLSGNMVEGWREYEARLEDPEILAKRCRFPGQPWAGQAINNKRIIVWCEQGLGDMIQFVRYLEPLKERAAEIILICPERLIRLFSKSNFLVRIISDEGPFPNAAYNVPLMSLPYLLETQNIPKYSPYLFAEDSLVSKWRKILGPPMKKRIGICWNGNPKQELNYQRSIPSVDIKILSELDEFEFISLQQVSELEGLKHIKALRDIGNYKVDYESAFIDTVAIMFNLDLIITVDTAIAHLAGALGVRTWLLLPSCPDWRWLYDHESTNWYPNMKLFRQTKVGDWVEVIERVSRSLRKKEFLN